MIRTKGESLSFCREGEGREYLGAKGGLDTDKK